MDILDDTRHSSTRFHRRCYDIDVGHLRRVIGIMTERTRGTVDIILSLDGSESISGTSIDALLKNSMLDVLSIDEIRLRASKIRANDLDEFSLLYRQSNAIGAIRVNIGGKTDAVVAAREEIDRIIGSSSRWFWPLNYKGHVIAFFLYMIAIGSIGILAAAYTLLIVLPHESLKEYSNVTGIGFGLLSVFYVNSIWYLRDTFFPVMEFRIGKSGVGADFRDTLRKYVFVTALGGIALSFLGRLVWERLAGSVTPPK